MAEFTPEQAILIAKSAGLDVTDLERQTRETYDNRVLHERVSELEAQLDELRSGTTEPTTPEQQQAGQGQHMLDSIRRQGIGPFAWVEDSDATP
jgi:hypothetical protein